MAELVIPDKTKEENIADKKKKKSHRKNGIKNTKNLRAESEKCLKLHKISKKLDKKDLALKSEKTVTVNNCAEPKKVKVN